MSQGRGQEVICTEKTAGRPPWDPEVILRVMVLGYPSGYSEKRQCDEMQMQLGFRWSSLLQPSEGLLDRAALVKMHNGRWQREMWLRLLGKTTTAYAKVGLVSGRQVALGGTSVAAKSRWCRCGASC